MKPHIVPNITVGTLRTMTVEQFQALRDNILNDGMWETASGVDIIGSGDHLGVQPRGGTPEQPYMYIGIERDGYTHS